ncbi:MAG: hypothetical protein A3G33_04490 [Omnitrophica bacterium RIFCSPLOWO2_12_FULL_44_17]|uniref:YbgF trimerisation domain-containing protein n=1 Tax=Candidatus Danuiimicrobium aquiferis TaxID=1801832 RepID=A0A1G1KQJ1_9BACT|nr:MAG: hypothetical protein A3B72_10700 [Omnitrophica bacterium RIFCSPHIGHO2_02_FULL_45_28]OGW95193.1 MAG: hypothetical protein A3G33_04490 [Omnitrophica bacterium RIFCSPLOWO2_12_FULL_44_17]
MFQQSKWKYVFFFLLLSGIATTVLAADDSECKKANLELDSVITQVDGLIAQQKEMMAKQENLLKEIESLKIWVNKRR